MTLALPGTHSCWYFLNRHRCNFVVIFVATVRIRLSPPDGLSITRQYSAILPVDQPTKMLPALPGCELSYTATSYMELYNLNGSFVAARTDNVNDSVIMKLAWNHIMYPTLNTTLNGRYVCRTDSLTARDPFDLTVLGKFTLYCY